MSIYENVGEKSVRELVEDLHTNTTVLPEFQRDFVWAPAATVDLLISKKGLCFRILNQFVESFSHFFPFGTHIKILYMRYLQECRDIPGNNF